MKKTLVTAAFLGTLTFSAFAAPTITLYGSLDDGLVYRHTDYDRKGVDSVDTVSMESGWNTAARWGVRGEEKLGSVTLGYKLESGFSGDTGVSAQGGRLFGREALLSLKSDYGTVYFGRLGGVMSDYPTLGQLGRTTPFGTAFSDLGGHGSTGSAWARYDNAIAYASPVSAGFNLDAMYSFKSDSVTNKTSREGSSDSDRYAAVTLGYKNGGLDLLLAADYTMYGNSASYAATHDVDNGWSVIFGGSYDFGAARIFAKGTYFANQPQALDTFDILPVAIKGWGASVGARVPAFGGAFGAEVGYRDAKDVDDSNQKYKRWNASLRYDYSLSKRTIVYAAGGYVQEKDKAAGETPNTVLVGGGLIHKF